MKPENEMTEELRQLLDSLEEHGKNVRRQKDLEALIDALSDKEQGTGTSLRGGTTKQPNLTIIWWAIGTAAAVLLLWLMIKPTTKHTLDINEEILVEETMPVDSVKDEVEEVILEEPIIVPVIAKEETRKVHRPQGGNLRPKQSNLTQSETDTIQVGLSPEGDELRLLRSARNDVAEVIPMESMETIENTDSINKHQRRVIRSLNLVCYECQTENGEWEVKSGEWKVENGKLSTFNFHLSTQAQDPNMKNGAMTFELKLN